MKWWSKFWVFDFYETFICYRGVLRLNWYIGKKVQKNFLMGLKIWWSWGSREKFWKSQQVGRFLIFHAKLQVLPWFLLFLSKKTTFFSQITIHGVSWIFAHDYEQIRSWTTFMIPWSAMNKPMNRHELTHEPPMILWLWASENPWTHDYDFIKSHEHMNRKNTKLMNCSWSARERVHERAREHAHECVHEPTWVYEPSHESRVVYRFVHDWYIWIMSGLWII